MKARDNPFASDRVEALLDFEPSWSEPGLDWTGLLDRWRTLNFRATIVGPHGSGKTTLLHSLAALLTREGSPVCHLFLNDRHKTLGHGEWRELKQHAAQHRNAVVLLDGAERLTWLAWRRFQKTIERHGTRAIATRHRPRYWSTLISTKTSPSLLGHLIRKLAPGPRFDPTEPQIRDLFDRHRGNLRAALRECYDLAADRAGSRRIAHFQHNQPIAAATAEVTSPIDLTQIQ